MTAWSSLTQDTIRSTIPVGLGLATFRYLQSLNPFIRQYIKDSVPETDSSKKPFTGVKPFDTFLKAIIPFFRVSADDDATRAVAIPLLTLATSWTTFAAIEGIRKGGSVIHFGYLPISLLVQVIGVSVAVPLVWTPLYFSFPPTSPRISPISVALVAAGQFISLIPTAAMYNIPEPERTQAIAWFQIAPFLGWFTWAAAPLIEKLVDTEKIANFLSSAGIALGLGDLGAVNIDALGHAAARNLFLINTGFGIFSHIFNVADFVFRKKDSTYWKSLKSIFFPSNQQLAKKGVVGHFLAVDAVVLYLSMLWIVYVGDGRNAVLKILALTPVIGPSAAFSLHWANREQIISGSA